MARPSAGGLFSPGLHSFRLCCRGGRPAGRGKPSAFPHADGGALTECETRTPASRLLLAALAGNEISSRCRRRNRPGSARSPRSLQVTREVLLPAWWLPCVSGSGRRRCGRMRLPQRSMFDTVRGANMVAATSQLQRRRAPTCVRWESIGSAQCAALRTPPRHMAADGCGHSRPPRAHGVHWLLTPRAWCFGGALRRAACLSDAAALDSLAAPRQRRRRRRQHGSRPCGFREERVCLGRQTPRQHRRQRGSSSSLHAANRRLLVSNVLTPRSQ
jgi:hypothetical protein